MQAGDEPFREIQISNRADAAAGALQDGSAATASDGSAAAALEQEASRLADHCLQSFSNLPADSRVLLLKGCLSRLREQLGEEVSLVIIAFFDQAFIALCIDALIQSVRHDARLVACVSR